MALLFLLFIVFAWVFGLPVGLYTTCMPDVHGGQKRVSDLLELELQTVVNYRVGAGDQTWVFSQSV